MQAINGCRERKGLTLLPADIDPMAYLHNLPLVDEILNPWFSGSGFMPWFKHMVRYWIKVRSKEREHEIVSLKDPTHVHIAVGVGS
jgi:hypothetical protein